MEQHGKSQSNEFFLFYDSISFRVGRPDAPIQQDIVLSGSHIESEHCILTNLNHVVHLRPCSSTAMCYVNGKQVNLNGNVELTSGSRVIFGKSHVFRFLNPEEARRRTMKNDLVSSENRTLNNEPTDWTSAIQELLEKQGVDIKQEMDKRFIDFSCQRRNKVLLFLLL